MKYFLFATIATLVASACAEAPERGQDLVKGPWINNPKPSLKLPTSGVTLLHFWTADCINCRHNLPPYERLYRRFGNQGLHVIGIHTPETAWERNLSHVRKVVKSEGIQYPVLIDNDQKNWDKWNIQAWPTAILIDKYGRVRDRWEGEFNFGSLQGEKQFSSEIEQILQEK
jgi:thiol-disulfide isomerase/thioredoxin